MKSKLDKLVYFEVIQNRCCKKPVDVFTGTKRIVHWNTNFLSSRLF